MNSRFPSREPDESLFCDHLHRTAVVHAPAPPAGLGRSGLPAGVDLVEVADRVPDAAATRPLPHQRVGARCGHAAEELRAAARLQAPVVRGGGQAQEFVFRRTSHTLNPPKTVSLHLDGEVLVARGSAPHRWIMDTRKLVRTIPGISQFKDEELVDADLVEFKATRESLEKSVLLFVLNSTALMPGQENQLERVAAEVRRLQDLGQITGRDIRIEIVGHTDSSGTETKNMHLSQKRAEEIRSFVAGKGISPAILNAVGVGTSEPVREETSVTDVQSKRSVTFRISSSEAGSRELQQSDNPA